MDREEKMVKDYLEHNGYEDVKYEPDGNIPPDFLVNGEIAIEVRRLNKLISEFGKPKDRERLLMKVGS